MPRFARDRSLFRAQPHIAAVAREMYAGRGLAGLECQALAGTVSGFDRLWAEAIVDIAAQGLHIVVRRGLACEVQSDVPAHGFTVELRIGGSRERRGNGAGYGLESGAGHRSQRQTRVAAHGGDLSLGIAAA